MHKNEDRASSPTTSPSWPTPPVGLVKNPFWDMSLQFRADSGLNSSVCIEAAYFLYFYILVRKKPIVLNPMVINQQIVNTCRIKIKRELSMSLPAYLVIEIGNSHNSAFGLTSTNPFLHDPLSVNHLCNFSINSKRHILLKCHVSSTHTESTNITN